MLILFVGTCIYSIREYELYCALDENTSWNENRSKKEGLHSGPSLAYVVQPTTKIWEFQTSKHQASPHARHYHVCLPTACALGGTQSLVRKEEESIKRGNKEYILVCSQDSAHGTKLFP